MSSKIKVDTIENVAGSGNVSLGSGHNLVVPGDLAVDTNVLKVDSTNNRVGINITSPSDDFELTPSADGKGMTLKTSSNIRPYLNFDANRSGAGNNLSQINFKWNGTDVARIIAVAGADTSNKDDGHLTFSTASAGSPTEAMRVDSAGRITKPLQPSFAAYVSSASTFDANSTGNHYVNYNTDLYDTGNNHSAGVFTAPVAGVYFFRAEAYLNAASTQSWFVVNGGRENATDTVYRETGSTFVGNSAILKLSANDTVSFHPYDASNSTMTVNANANHSWFRGMLIG